MYHYPKKDDMTEINSYLLFWGIDSETTGIPYKVASKGNWFMGANKDGAAISYTSPCSRGKGKHEYTIALYALSETSTTLPNKHSLDVNYNVFMDALTTVEIIDRTTLTFVDSN
ncbi:Phosphatidylethanolamine-binding protein [Kriegella aquimaris]|uniref:Phosphatidylethanolamine-binding protein n=1 Tax=Kriegella aquimaris TaxID=192904 RepID=A0A1G9IN45_9FLAO|nr:Phosphatidylethanolamine-binding protein [Kriegella aquimaris]